MLKRDNAVLAVVDIQGKLATLMHQREAFYDNVVGMINGCRALQIPIIWNEQLPDKLGETIPEVKEALTGHSPLIKSTFSCAENDEFMRILENLKRRQILLVGMEAHVCIYQTAIDLLEKGYEIYLVADCVSSRTLANKEIAIEAITQAGAKITSLEMVLTALVRVAQGDEFKQVLKIIK